MNLSSDSLFWCLKRPLKASERLHTRVALAAGVFPALLPSGPSSQDTPTSRLPLPNLTPAHSSAYDAAGNNNSRCTGSAPRREADQLPYVMLIRSALVVKIPAVVLHLTSTRSSPVPDVPLT
jgi:hypothetical protein